jgi:hypothetical protein
LATAAEIFGMYKLRVYRPNDDHEPGIEMGCEQQQYQHCPGWRRENRDRIDDEGRKENKKVGLH